MNTSKKLMLGLIMIAGIGAINAAAVAGMKDGQHRGDRVERLTKKLELTEQQSDEVKQLIEQYSSDKQRLSKEQMKQKRQQHRADLEALYNDPNFDEQAVRAKMALHSKKRQDKMLNRMKLQHAIYQLLNSEQQQQYLKMLEHRMGKKHHGHHDKKH